MFLKTLFKTSSTRNQFISTFAVNIIALSHGCSVGWLSPFLPYLKSSETHLTTGPVNAEDVSWIGSLLCVGGLFGTIAFGVIAEKIGKRNAMFLLVIPQLSFWCLIFLSTHVYHLYLARTLAGVTGGGILRTISLFVPEISENKIRGMLGSIYVFSVSCGILLIFIVGAYVDFFFVPLLILILPLLFICALFFLHDTPASLISRNKHEEAFESLKFYRTCGEDKTAIENVKLEFETLKKSLEYKNEEKLELKDFLTESAKRGMLVGMFLIFLNQFSGNFAIMTYAADIFKSSGSNLSSNESSIVLAVIQLIGIYVSSICVDRFGRKILLAISSAGTALFLFTLATYTYLNQSGYDLSQFSWIPVISLSLAILLASLGIIPLPFIIITELLPQKIRNAACTICMSSITVFAFIVLKIFPPMVKEFGLHGSMWFFSAVCLFGMIVSVFFIPETKGKSLIQNEI